MGKKPKKGKSIVWFGPDDEKFTGVQFKGIKESVKGIPPDYGSGPLDYNGSPSFDPFAHSKGPYPDVFKKSSKTKKVKKRQRKKK